MSGSLVGRYVLREVTWPFLAATAVLLSLFYAMMLVRGVDFLLGSAAQVSDWLMLGSAMLPLLLAQVLPIAVLLGVMIGFARLSEDGELTALAAVGVSPAALVKASVVLGTAVSVVLAGTVLFWKPWGIAQMRRTAQEVIERNVLGDLKPGAIRADIPGLVFMAEEVAPGPTWRQVLLVDERDPARVSVLTAPRAEASFSGGVGMAFHQGLLVQRVSEVEYSTTAFEDGLMLLNLSDPLRRRDTFRFGHEERSPLEFLAEARAAEQRGEPSGGLRAAFHSRLSLLLSPLALGVLATAIAQGGRKRAARTAAVLAVGVYLAFFVSARVGVQLGERGVLTPWVAGHLPVVAVFALALALLARLSRRGLR